MRGNEKVRDVGSVNFACDSSVVAGRRRSLRTVRPSGAIQTRRKTAVSRVGVVVSR